MFFNVAMQMKEQFYKLIALGLGTVYGFQVFLTVGGVTKFIPSTGVTLPLVAYGGSSLFSTMIMFAVVQGLYIRRQDEGQQMKEKMQHRQDEEKQDLTKMWKLFHKNGKKKKNTKNRGICGSNLLFSGVVSVPDGLFCVF